ncbi:MAG: hypothetical protein BZY65_00720 [SAR202 cluster bacterium Ae2-Chloro-G2]|nr:MAG: hypothetical protein BZY65_00720 [SAR202 cluster bacterium Ae2-Chloro-G2]
MKELGYRWTFSATTKTATVPPSALVPPSSSNTPQIIGGETSLEDQMAGSEHGKVEAEIVYCVA